MPVSERVADDDEVEAHGKYLIGKVKNKYRIYEDGSYYSQTSGGVIKKGTAVRRWDPDARDKEGKFAEFPTITECEQYIDRWLSR